MSVEITFPLEFAVKGTPVSLQAKRPATREAWKDRVRQASTAALPEGHFSTAAPLSVTLLYFPGAPMPGDLDNIVKPVLDALCRHVYLDDGQIERIWVQKFEPGRARQVDRPSRVLAEAMSGPGPILYVRLDADPGEGMA